MSLMCSIYLDDLDEVRATNDGTGISLWFNGGRVNLVMSARALQKIRHGSLPEHTEDVPELAEVTA